MSRLKLVLGLAICLGFLALATWFFLDDPSARRQRPRVAPAPSVQSVAPASVAVAEPEPEPIRPKRVNTRSLKGRVTDADKAPLAQTRVTVTIDGRDFRTRTDVDGRYAFDGLPRKAGRVEFVATGYERERERAAVNRAVIDVRLTPRAGLIVLVRALGEPVDDARVTLQRTGVWTGVRIPFATGTSDGSGRAFLRFPDGVEVDTLVARHSAHGSVSVSAPAPGSGQIILDLPGGGYVTGRVIDQDRVPIQSVSITASGRSIRQMPTQSFDSSDGTYRFGPVAPGTLTLHAAAEGYQPGKRKIVVKSGETLTGADLMLKASLNLIGRVTDAESGDPIAGAQVIPAEWRAGALAESVGAYTDEDGRYILSALPGNRTSVRVKADGYRSVLIGGVQGPPGEAVTRDFSLTRQRTDQVPATELTGIGAVLSRHPKGVRIGRILDGGPAGEVLAQGDVVVAIDGQKIGGQNISKAAQAIRGEEGTDIELMVLRGGAGEPVPLVITRSRVTVPSRHHPRN
ncbi:MAG: hypothetical protein ACI9U2_000103 [Bradymonadia bacterium]|jgi:hypothetical protein